MQEEYYGEVAGSNRQTQFNQVSDTSTTPALEALQSKYTQLDNKICELALIAFKELPSTASTAQLRDVRKMIAKNLTMLNKLQAKISNYGIKSILPSRSDNLLPDMLKIIDKTIEHQELKTKLDKLDVDEHVQHLNNQPVLTKVPNEMKNNTFGSIVKDYHQIVKLGYLPPFYLITDRLNSSTPAK